LLNIHKTQRYKLAWAVLLVSLMLGGLVQMGSASHNEQTVPTAPPPTVMGSPTITYTDQVQPTRVTSEPTQAMATSLPSDRAGQTDEGIPATPTILPSKAGELGAGTVFPLTETANVGVGTATAVLATGRPISSEGVLATPKPFVGGSETTGVTGWVVGVGVVLLLLAVVVWYVRSRREGNSG
jgi:hypothetical protein